MQSTMLLMYLDADAIRKAHKIIPRNVKRDPRLQLELVKLQFLLKVTQYICFNVQRYLAYLLMPR